jgi:hypothetical protein
VPRHLAYLHMQSYFTVVPLESFHSTQCVMSELQGVGHLCRALLLRGLRPGHAALQHPLVPSSVSKWKAASAMSCPAEPAGAGAGASASASASASRQCQCQCQCQIVFTSCRLPDGQADHPERWVSWGPLVGCCQCSHWRGAPSALWPAAAAARQPLLPPAAAGTPGTSANSGGQCNGSKNGT